MRKILSILMLQAWLVHYGQTGPALQRQMEGIISRMAQLEKENQRLNREMRARDSIAYCSLRLEIFEAFIKAPELVFDFKTTSEKIAVTGLFAKLMQANNPTSDILGFRFTEIILNACEKYFSDELKKEKDRIRFSQVITKIINNPVVSSLARTNPVASVVSGIISTIAGFSTPVAEIKKEGGRIRDVEVSNQDVFEQNGLSDFRNEIQVYINFYDALICASENYLAGLEDLDSKYAPLIQSIKSYQDRLYSATGRQEDNILISLATFLPDPQSKKIDFQFFLTNGEIRNTLLIAREYPALEQTVSGFKNDYNSLLFYFLSEYLGALDSARHFPAGVVDQAKIDQLASDIISFIDSQKSSGKKEPDVFGGK